MKTDKQKTEQLDPIDQEITHKSISNYVEGKGVEPQKLFDKEFMTSMKRHHLINDVFGDFSRCRYAQKSGVFYTKFKLGEKWSIKYFEQEPDFRSIASMNELVTQVKRYRTARNLEFQKRRDSLEMKQGEKDKTDELEK